MLYKKPFGNIVEKGENGGNQYFLLFIQCFLPFPKQTSIFQSHLFCHLQMLSIWTSLKFCCLVELTQTPKRQILDSSKLKETADNNFKSNKNVRKFSKRVENTVGKGEIAHHEQFLLFTWCFQMTYKENGRKFSRYVKTKKHCRKGEIAHYEQFLLFPQCFLYCRHVKTRACLGKG